MVAATLDSALKERLRAVLDRQPVTEAELRKLAEEGRACNPDPRRAARGEPEHLLAELSADPASSLVDVADALRAVNELRPDLAELEELLDAVQTRAREFAPPSG